MIIVIPMHLHTQAQPCTGVFLKGDAVKMADRLCSSLSMTSVSELGHCYAIYGIGAVVQP